jgi:abhydrolase domain-containing protein 6
LIAAHGVTEPQQSELAASVARGDNWLVVSSLEGHERLMNKLFVRRPYVPGAVLKYMAQQTVRRSAKTKRIFDEIQAISPPLLDCLPQIKAPTLIVWGDDDKLIHFSAAEIFHKAIGNSEVVIMSKTGHMPLLENVKQCGSAYVVFLEKQRRSSHAAA